MDRMIYLSMSGAKATLQRQDILAHNLAKEEITGQAIPSVTPGESAPHFKKIECFCFTRQTLKPGETREMNPLPSLSTGLPLTFETR